MAYPAYISMKAVETKEKTDDTKWLTYWYAKISLCSLTGLIYICIILRIYNYIFLIFSFYFLVFYYRVIFATFSTFEFFSLYITKIIPFYWLIKCAFFIWCMAPIENNGSVIMYYKVIRPYFLKHESSMYLLFFGSIIQDLRMINYT